MKKFIASFLMTALLLGQTQPGLAQHLGGEPAEDCVGGPGHTHDEVEENNDLKLALLDNAILRTDPYNQGNPIGLPEEEELEDFLGQEEPQESQQALTAPQAPAAENAELLKESFDYYADGLLKSYTDAEGRKTEYFYDAAKQLVKVSYADGSSVLFSYDANGNRTSMTDQTGTTRYKYDEFNRLTEVTDSKGRAVKYTYDLVGNLTSVADPTEETTRFKYDADSRLIEVSSKEGTTGYSYDKAGNLAKKIFPNQITMTLGYDKANRLTDLVYTDAQGKLLLGYHYTLDTVGNRTQIVEETPEGKKITQYFYDAMDQLVRVIDPNGEATRYEYDAAGNRTKMITPKGTVGYQYDTAGRLIKAGETDYFWDKNGNLVRKKGPEGETRFEWNPQGRLVKATTPKEVIEFVYDGDGNRVAKIGNGKRTDYVVDVNTVIPQVMLEMNAQGEVDRRYLLAGADRIGTSSADGNQFYLADGLGSIQGLVNAQGKLTAEYEYDAFGTVTSTKGASAKVNSFLFTGEQTDAETGLVYLRNRYYDPSTGRFISADPFPPDLTVPQTLNEYVYVGNNPVNYVDPTGMFSHWAIRRGIIGALWAGGSTFVGGLIGSNNLRQDLGKIFKQSLTASAAGFAGGFTGGSFKPIQRPAGTSPLRPFEVQEGFPSALGKAVTGLVKRPSDVALFSAQLVLTGLISAVWGAPAAIALGVASTLLDPIASRLGEASGIASTTPSPSISDFGGRFDVQSSAINGIPSTGSGGVSLEKTAELLLNVTDIVGVTFDEKSGQLILLSKERKGTSLPPVRLEDILVAIRAIYYLEEEPQFGLKRNESGDRILFEYGGGIAGTHFGKRLAEADLLLKGLRRGIDFRTGEPLKMNVPGYKSEYKLREEYEAEHGPLFPNGETTGSRLWFQPHIMDIQITEDGKMMLFDEFEMAAGEEACTVADKRVKNPVSEDFVEHLTKYYDEYAKEFPVLEELRQLAKIVGIVKWMKENHIPLDHSWLGDFSIPRDNPLVIDETGDPVVIYGGIDLRFPPTYTKENQGELAKVKQAVLSAQKDPLTFQWDVELEGERFTATALSSIKLERVGNLILNQTDFVAESQGSLDISLTRYYNSFNQSNGPLGEGWSLGPQRLEFPKPLETVRVTEATVQGDIGFILDLEIKVLNYVTGKEETYEFESVRKFSATLENPTAPLEGVEAEVVYKSRDPSNDKELILFWYWDQETISGASKTLENGIKIRPNSNGLTLHYELFNPESRINKLFDVEGNLIGEEDPFGNLIQWVYEEVITKQDLLQATVDTEGLWNDLTKNGYISSSGAVQPIFGNLTSSSEMKLGEDYQTKRGTIYNILKYDKKGRLLKISDGKREVGFQHDSANRISAAVLPTGEKITYLYQGDLLSQVKYPDGDSQRFEYDKEERLKTVFDSAGNPLLDNQYDSFGRLTEQKRLGLGEVHFAYGLDNRQSVSTDPLGALAVVGYDEKNRPTSFLNPLGNKTQIQYDPLKNRPIAYVDSLGNQLTLAYTGDYLQSVSLNGKLYLSFAYDVLGKITSMKDALENVTSFSYNQEGDLVQLKSAMGITMKQGFDEFSRLTSVEDLLGNFIRFQYDNRDLVTRIENPFGAARLQYDARRNLTALFDPLGRKTEYRYDDKNNLTGVVTVSGAMSEYGYDRRDNLASIKDLLGDESRLEYDLENRLIGVLRPSILYQDWDLNLDDDINIVDLVTVANAFGTTAMEGDVNGDGDVDILDLVLVSSHFGQRGVVAR